LPSGQKRLRVLSVGLAWESATGGHTVTRELSIGMAEAGHDVRMWLPEPVTDPGVPNLLVHHPTRHGERLGPDQSKADRAAAEQRMLVTPDGLPDDVDVIIGHAAPRTDPDRRRPPPAGDRPKLRRARLQPITLVGPNEREVERRAA
jgi:H2-forming N5,N10-methylenetetrahydromethanopterin dehydrogenase-like enzyme